MFKELKNKKNLLAFSGGTDSSALFHMLTNLFIDFDMIMVNYNSRTNSKEEVLYAQALANKFNKKLYLLDTTLSIDKSNFEKRARDIRYDFFDKSMINYDNLLLGHNLSDKVEWFFMQFVRGAGIKELYGMNKLSKRKNYTLARPLLDLSKKEILDYLNSNDVKYFYDESNNDTKFTRNYFRHSFTEKLLDGNEKGILKTFSILNKEKELLPKETLIEEIKEYVVYNISFSMASNLLSKLLKEKGYLLSGEQRKEFDESEELTITFNGSYYTGTYREGKLYFSPYRKDVVMDKTFKELMRKNNIPPKHRTYLFLENKVV